LKGGAKGEDERISIEQSSLHSFHLVSYDHNVTMKATLKLQTGAMSYDPELQSLMTNHKKKQWTMEPSLLCGFGMLQAGVILRRRSEECLVQQ
jgi:hypothetical protein